MKQEITRIRLGTLILLSFLMMFIASGCQKDKNLPDYASQIAGTYSGTVTVVGTGTVSCTSTLTKSSNQKVDLKITIGSNSTSLTGIKVSNSAGDVYNLTLTDSSGSFTGTVNGNTLTWDMTAGSIHETFSGSR
jgi:hypothetical protein